MVCKLVTMSGVKRTSLLALTDMSDRKSLRSRKECQSPSRKWDEMLVCSVRKIIQSSTFSKVKNKDIFSEGRVRGKVT